MNWKENMARSKEVLSAEFRQGLKELGAALYGPGTVAQPAEYGMPGTKLPSEVAEGRRSVELAKNDEPRATLDERVKAAEAEASRSAEREAEMTRDEREMTRE